MQEIKFQAQVTSFNIKTENRLKAQFTSILLKEVKKPTQKEAGSPTHQIKTD